MRDVAYGTRQYRVKPHDVDQVLDEYVNKNIVWVFFSNFVKFIHILQFIAEAWQ